MRTARAIVLVTALAVAGCGGGRADYIECRDDSSCTLEEGGKCLRNPETDHEFCAYPDPSCPGTEMRWSTLDVEESIAGECVAYDALDGGIDAPAPDAIPEYQLTVMVGGNGSGSVVSDPPGIDCAGGACVATFTTGTSVTLTATPSNGVFLGWSDSCTGVASCSVTVDGNTFVGALFGLPGEALWVDQVGAESTGDVANDVTVDGGDNVLVVGTFSGTVNLGGVELISAGGSDVFVAKLDSSTGQAIWAKRFGGSEADTGNALEVDATGDVIVAGGFAGTVNFGGSTFTSAGNSDIFLMKLSGVDGSHVWSHAYGNTGVDVPKSVAVDSAGDVAVGGFFNVSVNFGGATLTSAGGSDIFLAKFTGNAGGHVWSKSFGAASSDVAWGVAIDSNGDVVATGSYFGTVNFGGGNLISAGSADIWLAKYSAATGAYLFAQRYGSTGFDQAYALALNGVGHVYLAGTFQGTVNFGGASDLVASNGFAIVVAKYTIAGAHVWSHSYDGTGTEEIATGVAVDPVGNVAVTGSFCGTLNFGGNDLSAASACATGDDVFVVRFDNANGDHLVSGRYGGTGHEAGKGIAQASDGRMYAVGLFAGFSEFGGFPLTNAGGDDGFIVGLAPLN